MTTMIYNSSVAFTEYNGAKVVVLRRINDIVDNNGHSHPAFEVRFPDGARRYAYAAELSSITPPHHNGENGS